MKATRFPSPADQASRAAAEVAAWTGNLSPRVIAVPHRICPLGAHLDHQGGPVLGRPIGALTALAYAPLAEGAIRLRSPDFGQVSFATEPEALLSKPVWKGWYRYAKAVALVLGRRAQISNGFAGVITAPADGGLVGAGLSSSASVTLAYLRALADVNDIALSLTDEVELVRLVENDVLGLPNGVLDQSILAHGTGDGFLLVDTRTRNARHIPDPSAAGQVAWLLIHSGVGRELQSTNYALRVAQCWQAAMLLEPHAEVLSDVPPEVFRHEGARLPATQYRRAAHYFGEVARVEAGAEAWAAGDFARFGALMNESCDSSIRLYESGHPALIDLQQQLEATPGVYGSRFSGGGFGGCLVALADAAAVDDIAEQVGEEPEGRRVYLAPLPAMDRRPAAAIVLAAGRGLRLRPLTDQTPKPLLPVDSRPTLDYVLASLANAGIRRAVVVTGHLAEQVEAYLGDGERWGMEVRCCQQKTLDGTAGALWTALDGEPDFLGRGPWLVTAADYALPPGYVERLVRAHAWNAADVTVAVKAVEPAELTSRSSAAFAADGRVACVVEKPPAGEAPSHLVASLTFIMPRQALPYVREAAVNRRPDAGEVPWAEVINALLAHGYCVRGLELPAPPEVDADDLLSPERRYL